MSVLTIVASTDNIPGRSWKYVKFVCVNRTCGLNFLKDYFAKVVDFTGGNSESYKKATDKIVNEAFQEMIHIAEEAGADALVGVRMSVQPVSSKGVGMLMIVAYGTAVRLNPEIPPGADQATAG